MGYGRLHRQSSISLLCRLRDLYKGDSWRPGGALCSRLLLLLLLLHRADLHFHAGNRFPTNCPPGIGVVPSHAHRSRQRQHASLGVNRISLLSPTPVKESTDSCYFCHHCQPTWGLSFFLSLFVITPAHRPLIFSAPRKLLLSTWPRLPGSRLPRPPSISTRGV
jgi:hypothetical protein